MQGLLNSYKRKLINLIGDCVIEDIKDDIDLFIFHYINMIEKYLHSKIQLYRQLNVGYIE